MANAASAPSAAATMTHCTAREASPATNKPGRCVVSYFPVCTVPFSFNLTPELEEEIRSLRLAGREEHRAARQPAAAFEDDLRQLTVTPFEAGHAVFADRNAVARQTCAPVVVDLAGPVGAQDEIPAPAGQLERETEAAFPVAVDGNRPIADLPAVAIRAVKHAAPVEIEKALDRGQVVDDAGRQEELARPDPLPALERDLEPRVASALRGRQHARPGPKPSRTDAARSRASRRNSRGEMPSRVRYPCIAWEAALRGCPVSSTRTDRRQRPEHQRSTQTSRAGPDDDGVEHQTRFVGRGSRRVL